MCLMEKFVNVEICKCRQKSCQSYSQYLKLQTKIILDKMNICLRKKKKPKTKKSIGWLFKKFRQYSKFMKTGWRISYFPLCSWIYSLLGTSQKDKKDIFALIRQLGIPTWFTSFSAAETHWVHLLQILGQTVDKKQYTTEEVNKFDFFKKADLLRKDPVTCASHFDHQVQVFINQVLKSSVSHIGKVLDFFYKVEFQIQISNSSSMEIPYTVYFRYQEIKDLLTNLWKVTV